MRGCYDGLLWEVNRVRLKAVVKGCGALWWLPLTLSPELFHTTLKLISPLEVPVLSSPSNRNADFPEPVHQLKRMCAESGPPVCPKHP